MRQIINSFWFTSFRETIGAVAVRTENGWKVYLGTCPGINPDFDEQYIRDTGMKIPEKFARALFPMIKDQYDL